MIQQFDRFKDAPWFPQNSEPVMIGGAGGIGSWLSFFLTRIGFTPYIYDFDIIEAHNMGGQLFREKDIGKHKVIAVSEIAREFCGSEINTFIQKVDQTTTPHHFMFSAFDNMKARKDLFEVWKKSIPGCPVAPIFIDGRLEMEQFQIFCVTPDRIADYEATLFDDSEVDDAPCTMKQSSHTAAMIATMMTGFFTNHIANIYERQNGRFIPFYYEFYVPLVLTNITE